MRRNYNFELLRGLAAIVVVLTHISGGLFPTYRDSIRGTPLFILINGTSAVAVFFVLSGYVLTHSYFASSSASIIREGIIKRLPRLCFLTTLATVSSAVLFRLDLYSYADAGAITGSKWLATFANSDIAKGEQSAGFGAAIIQGTLTTFLRGRSGFDTSLWTMTFEFFGSILVMCASVVLATCFGPKQRLGGFVVFNILSLFISPYYLSFSVGCTMAAYSRYAPERALLAFLVAIAGAILLIFDGPFGIYAWSATLTARPDVEWAVRTTGAALLLWSLVRAGDTPAINRAGRWLGSISFPLYLVHVPVLASIGCGLLLRVGDSTLSRLAAGVATLIVSIAISIPLALFDRRWTTLVNTTARRWLTKDARKDPLDSPAAAGMPS